MSGGKSRSSTTSTSITDIDNSNTQINDNEGLVLNLEGAENSDATIIQSTTDFGAVESSFEFGESALDSVEDTVGRSLDTVDDSVDRAFDFGDESQQRSFAFGENVIDEAQETTRQALSVAGNAQNNAFAKIKDLTQAFSTSSS